MLVFLIHKWILFVTIFYFLLDNQVDTQNPNISTTPLRQWGFRQCLPFSWTTLRGKHCRHPIVVIRVYIDRFGQWPKRHMHKEHDSFNLWFIIKKVMFFHCSLDKSKPFNIARALVKLIYQVAS